MTLAIDLQPQPADGFVTATGGARSDDHPTAPTAATVTTIDTGELVDVSGGIVNGTNPFPRPVDLPLPSSPLPRPPTIPLGPFYPSSPRPDVA